MIPIKQKKPMVTISIIDVWKLSFSVSTKKHGDVRRWRAKHLLDIVYRNFDTSIYGNVFQKIISPRRRPLAHALFQKSSRLIRYCIT